MKNIKLAIAIMLPVIFMISSCGSINFKRDSGAKTVKMPFAEEDFQDNNTYFYSIQSTRGTGSKSAIKSATLTKAKNELAQKVRSQLISESNINQSGEDGGNFNESFNARISDQVNSAVESALLLKSEWLSYGKDISGREEYEFWGVYRIEKQNIR